MKNISVLIIFFLTAYSVHTQPVKNLDIIHGLIDRSVEKIDSSFDKENTLVDVVLPSPLEILKSKIIESFNSKNIRTGNAEGKSILKYVLSDISVKYPETFRDGLFGEYLIVREISLTGSYYKFDSGEFSQPEYFSLTSKDTVSYSDASELENKVIPFTQSSIPAPSLLSNLIEPVIIVGTLITTVILLFTIRSK